MKRLIPFSVLLLLAACATSEDTLHPNSMSYEEILAYNETQDRVWDQIYCVYERRVDSHIRKRHCATLAELQQGSMTAEQLNNINFGTPALFR
ncbi:MAG: hypothetical protein RL120_19030 [Gammaproteobacteria bacterium]